MQFTSRPRTFSDIVKQSTAGLIQELVLISLHILSAGVLQYPHRWDWDTDSRELFRCQFFVEGRSFGRGAVS